MKIYGKNPRAFLKIYSIAKAIQIPMFWDAFKQVRIETFVLNCHIPAPPNSS